MLKLLVVDDHPVTRSGLKLLIDRLDDMTIVAEASDGQEALEKTKQFHPDVIVLDISLPGRSGLDIIKELKNISPRSHILVLSHYPEDHYALRVLRSGASAYLTKASPFEELITALRKVGSGGKYVTPSVAEKLVSAVDPGVDLDKLPHERLSDREYEVLCLLGSGKTVSEIGEELSLSVKTVSTYRTRITEKMNMPKTAQLIRYALEHELVESASNKASVPSKKPRKSNKK